MLNRLEGVKALAYVSIMCSLCTLFVIAGMYIPFSTIAILLIIPLCTTFVVLKVDYKYTLIYSLSSTFISFIDPLNALFVVIPCIISGIVLGILLKKYIQGYLVIFYTSLTLILLQFFAQFLILWIFEKDVPSIYDHLLGFHEKIFDYIYLLFLFLISLAQATLSYIIISNELSKLSYIFNERKNIFIPILITTTLLLIFTIILRWFSFPLSYLFLGFTFYFGIILGVYNFSYYRKKEIMFLQIPLYAISIISFFVLSPYFEANTTIYLTLIIVISEILVSFYIIFYQKIIRKGQIDESLFDKLK